MGGGIGMVAPLPRRFSGWLVGSRRSTLQTSLHFSSTSDLHESTTSHATIRSTSRHSRVVSWVDSNRQDGPHQGAIPPRQHRLPARCCKGRARLAGWEPADHRKADAADAPQSHQSGSCATLRGLWIGGARGPSFGFVAMSCFSATWMLTVFSPAVKYLSLATSTFILRCSRSHYQMLWAVLTFMNHVPVKDGRPCIFRVIRVSGTMRKASEEAVRQSRRIILAAKGEMASMLSSAEAAEQDLRDQHMLDVNSDGSSDDAMGEDDG